MGRLGKNRLGANGDGGQQPTLPPDKSPETTPDRQDGADRFKIFHLRLLDGESKCRLYEPAERLNENDDYREDPGSSRKRA